jgi:hypothetical protein
MRTLALALAAAAALLSGTALQARDKPTGEERLARILDGRVAGEPVDCISLAPSQSSRVIDRTAIVYGDGRTVYVNRPNNARSLDSDDILVTELRGSNRLCRLDTVRLHDRSGGWYSGFVGLEQFVPYRRVAHAD